MTPEDAAAGPDRDDRLDRPILDGGSACPACGRPMERLWCRTRCPACGYFEGCED